MKTTKIIVLIGFFLGLCGCVNEDETVEISSIDVETYIELLKTDQYQSSKLPQFAPKDIPELIEYINDKSVIRKFPVNPVSSYSEPHPEYRLGTLILWTIESIRLSAFEDSLIHGFPSQHPFVKTKSEPIEWITKHEDKIYELVSLSYFNWWNENSHREFSDYSNIDPLENINYRWH